MSYENRRHKSLNLLDRLKVDALIFALPVNIRYLCGFTGSDGALVMTVDRTIFLTDSRYTTQAEEEVTADQIDEYKTKSGGIADALKGLGVGKVAFEADVSFGFVKDIQRQCGVISEWTALKEELSVLRLHKSSDELDCIAAATDLNVLGLDAVRDMIRPGVRESEIALALEYAMRREGAEAKSFDIIVASGERGAMPHGVASDKPLQNGELVTIDFGCRVGGYHSDETVTFAVGDVTAELRKIFDTVLEAHDRGLAAVRPGVELSALDNIARSYIEQKGFGQYFGHGLGHGVGLAVHEAPTVSPRSTLVAEEGMVFTIEPGIYIPGVGGVRIEDMVLVTSSGYQVLTKIDKTFRNILLN